MSAFPAPTVYGRGLVDELVHVANPPVLVVTMADLHPRFADRLPPGRVHLVESLERRELETLAASLDDVRSIVGLGGGQAIDVAKYVSWRSGLPLHLVPTTTSVNAPWGQRAAVRDGGTIRYAGWAAPESVYVDLDVIRTAPNHLNRSGIADVLCYHTAHWDWRRAHEVGATDPRWPYDQASVDEARAVLDGVLDQLDEVVSLTDRGIRALTGALRWGGAAFWANGWNPCPIEGSEHHYFYALEELTGQHFIHGQAVGLGLALMSRLQDNDADHVLSVLRRMEIDLRPEAMGITWEDVAEALRRLPDHVRRNGLWYSVALDRPITEPWITEAIDWLRS